METRCKPAQDIQHAALQFGNSIDGNAEFVVTIDMLGLHPFFYDKQRGEYNFKRRSFLWEIPISECKNPQDLALVPLPGNNSPEKFIANGLDSLGYIACVYENPELAEYVDNPGILVLIAADPDKAKAILAGRPKRIELVREMSGSGNLHKYHINWLKKVRAPREAPSVVSEKIKASLLRAGADDPQTTSPCIYPNQLFKLFAHQKRWTPRGLDFARELLDQPVANVDDIAYLLNFLNGEEPDMLSDTRQALLAFADDYPQKPQRVRKRALQMARSGKGLTMSFATRFRRAVFRNEPNKPSTIMDCCALFLDDSDIPAPILRGNSHVEPLDTLDKIRAQARLAKNCLWSPDILSSVIHKRLDLYAVKGENLYTFSLDRKTLDISMLEAQRGTMIKPVDLALISQWFSQVSNT